MEQRQANEGIDRRLIPDGGETCLPLRENTEELLAEFFDIDMKKVEEERRAMLDAIGGDDDG
jgi:hypothetical protein